VEDAPRPFNERLVDFGELGRGHQHDVEGDLAQRAGDQREQGDGFRKCITRHVPG
jgi:hypothetical protein